MYSSTLFLFYTYKYLINCKTPNWALLYQCDFGGIIAEIIITCHPINPCINAPKVYNPKTIKIKAKFVFQPSAYVQNLIPLNPPITT